MSDHRYASDDRYGYDDPDRVFAREVAPLLRLMEADRLAALATRNRRWMIGAAGVAAVAGALVWCHFAYGWSLVFPFVGVIASGIGAFFWASSPASAFVNSQRTTVMQAVCKHLGNMSYDNDASEFALAPFDDAQLLPGYSSSNVEDNIRGTYRNCAFSLAEVKLERRQRSGKSSSTVTVFKGLLIRIAVPQRVREPVIIAKDHGSWGGWANAVAGWFKPGDRVAIPHAAFEEEYEVYARNPADALAMITPAFAENLLALRRALQTNEILAAFVDDAFMLAANDTKPFLEGFSINTPVSELRATFEDVIAETKLVYDVIDQLHEQAGGT